MTNKNKQNIRYKKTSARIFKKKVYPQCPHLTKLLKLNERYEELNKSIDKTWDIMRGKGFKPMIDNENPDYFQDFENLQELELMRDKISTKIDKLEAKGYSLSEAKEAFYLLNQGRGSQSF